MRVRITGSPAPGPDLLVRFRQRAERALTAGMQGVAAGMLADMRAEIAAAFPRSRRMATTITGKGYPNRAGAASLEAAAVVRARGKSAAEILAAHRGATIRASGGRFLAVPTEAVPRVAGRRMRPKEVEARFNAELEILAARTLGPNQRNPVMVLRQRTTRRRRRGRVAVRRERGLFIMFNLVRQVELRRRLEPEALQAKWVRAAPALIDQAWKRLERGA